MGVAFVLHAHLPWVRKAGAHPVGEEWFHQAASESYLPLLDVLERLAADGHRDVLTLGITPVLAEQLADPYLLAELHGWLARRLVDLEYTINRYAAPDRDRLGEVWEHHWRRQTRLLQRVESGLLHSGLLAPFVALAEARVIELLGGPATHPYLPLVDDEAVLRGHVESGLATTQRLTGLRPAGVWTPECAYRPAQTVADPTTTPAGSASDGAQLLARSAHDLPGLETVWAEAGATHLVLDGPTLARAVGAPDRDWAAAGGDVEPPGGPLDVLDEPVLVGDSDLAAFGRNLAVSYAVWSPLGGYPGHGSYRDFATMDLEGGFKSHRVTARDHHDKEPYHVASAARVAADHAEEFAGLVRRHLDGRPEDATVVAAYDAELFGHWWYEGPVWLEAVVRRLAASARPAERPTTLARALERRPPRRRLALPESSWGLGKGHAAWVTERTRWIWDAVRDAERRFSRLEPGPARDAAWRQLTLLSASDWPFLVAKGTAAAYAAQRVRAHLARFDAACRGELAGLAELDGVVDAPLAGAPVR